MPRRRPEPMIEQKSGMSAELEARVAKTEANLETLSSSVVRLERHFEGFADEIRKIIRENAKPQYPTILSLLALVVTIGSLAFAPVIWSLNRMYEDQSYHTKLGGHPELAGTVDSTKDSIEVLQEKFHTHTMNGHPAAVKEAQEGIKDRVVSLEERVDSKMNHRFTRDDANRELGILHDRIDSLEERGSSR